MERLRRAMVWAAAAIFAVALVKNFHALGGPYFEIPETIQDHVAPEPYPSRDAIVLARRAAGLIPRGATVTVLVPSQAPNHDPTLFYTATGLMPRHAIVPTNANAQYVIALREPFDDPAYALVTEFTEGRIYVKR